jgi:hypothetical protein
MNRVLIARMNADEDAVDEFHRWYNTQHMEQASSIPGFGSQHRRYEAQAVAGKYWNYKSHPRFTAVYQLLPGGNVLDAINSVEYKAWSGDFLAHWRDRTHDEVSVLCEQIFGIDSSIDYEKVLIAQMNVDPHAEDEFHDWYNNEHIPQASKIPGFGSDHRRFQAFELEGKYWHYRDQPRFTAMYEIHREADFLEAIDSEEYKSWSGDFLSRWRDRTRDEISTLCTRIL